MYIIPQKMKIYLVGEGYDFTVRGVYDSRELAQRYIDSVEDGDLSIEEWELTFLEIRF
jgi:hypothetical protein